MGPYPGIDGRDCGSHSVQWGKVEEMCDGGGGISKLG